MRTHACLQYVRNVQRPSKMINIVALVIVLLFGFDCDDCIWLYKSNPNTACAGLHAFINFISFHSIDIWHFDSKLSVEYWIPQILIIVTQQTMSEVVRLTNSHEQSFTHSLARSLSQSLAHTDTFTQMILLLLYNAQTVSFFSKVLCLCLIFDFMYNYCVIC